MKNVTKALVILFVFATTLTYQLSAQDFAYQSIGETSQLDYFQSDRINIAKTDRIESRSTISELADQLKQFLVVPSIVQEFELTGKSVVNIYIDNNGAITKTKILQSINPSMDDAINTALNQITGLEPITVNGKSAAQVIQLPIVIK